MSFSRIHPQSSTSQKPRIYLERLTKRYPRNRTNGEGTALKNRSLEVYLGEIVGIIGSRGQINRGRDATAAVRVPQSR